MGERDYMNILVDGKTKKLLRDEATGDIYLFFKDSATGENGVLDPGSNTVGGSMPGKGKTGLMIAKYFFELMERHNLPTQYLDVDIDQNLMRVRKLTVPKLEFILRYFTAGSMCRRFSLEPGLTFDPPYFEVTLKDDAAGDPLISERLCMIKGLLKPGQYKEAYGITIQAGEILKHELSKLSLTLIDFKLEFGFDENEKIYIADEISPDIWRVKDKTGNIPNQIECAKLICERLFA